MTDVPTPAEQALLNDPEAMERINEGLDAAANGDVVDIDPAEKLKELKDKQNND